MKIYFKTGKKLKNIKDIKELLKIGFSTTNPNFKITYKDEECTEQECHSARRSFGDLMRICKTYFPRTKKEELAKVLFELNTEINLICCYCTTICKIVFYKHYYGNARMDTNIYNRDIKGKGRISFSEIEKLAA